MFFALESPVGHSLIEPLKSPDRITNRITISQETLNTPLHSAAYNGHAAVVKHLCGCSGIKVDVPDAVRWIKNAPPFYLFGHAVNLCEIPDCWHGAADNQQASCG